MGSTYQKAHRLAIEVCDAQKESGYTDGRDRKAINFCMNSCPYPDYCVLVETPTKRNRVVELHQEGKTPTQIAETLGIKRDLVYRHRWKYRKENKENSNA